MREIVFGVFGRYKPLERTFDPLSSIIYFKTVFCKCQVAAVYCLCMDLEKNDPPLFSFGCNIWRKNTLCWLITFSSSKALKDWGERAVKFVCPHCNRRLVQHPLRWNSFLQFTSVHSSNWFLVCLCLVLVESSPPTHCDGTHSGPEVVVVAVLPPPPLHALLWKPDELPLVPSLSLIYPWLAQCGNISKTK